ncbi:hypothetical protein EXIGLDRAFT_829720 [Exidia glandulosa HHB12029]|uniref:Uncharacterized protein n=1 Tax=Exidia glandulosa HHB12029 TaxID=1314781 RepID=A0A165P874_EXIGL|nr:hypothetical protein EXIGLDRAFT_829720 [Exidia glandulosa HHB12029]
MEPEVVESPVYCSWPPHGDKTERFWRFVLFSVNALASVAGLEDAEATHAASALPRTKFLGIIIGAGDVAVLQPNFEYRLTLELLLVGVGLPDEYEHACVDVPIAPTSFHPEGRPAIQTTTPLPWDNLYVYTRRSFNAVSTHSYPGFASVPTPPISIYMRSIGMW